MTSKPSPHSADDTFDLIDDALDTLAERRGIWLGDDLATMTLIASLIEQAGRCLPQVVHDARANGHTWHEIAQALGTSPGDARLRFDPNHPPPTADCHVRLRVVDDQEADQRLARQVRTLVEPVVRINLVDSRRGRSAD